MMWCGLADFRYAGFSRVADLGGTNTLRELSGAVALELLLRSSGGLTNWIEFNRTLEMLVGTPDSLNFAQLNGLLVAAGINSPADLPNQTALTNLQNQLMSGQLGMQQITSGYYYSPFSAVQVKLPRSFCFMGQRFVMDSWAFSKNTFDSIIWDEDGIPSVWDKVLRRVPSALDVAFAVLGNNQVVPEIAARIARTNLTIAGNIQSVTQSDVSPTNLNRGLTVDTPLLPSGANQRSNTGAAATFPCRYRPRIAPVPPSRLK